MQESELTTLLKKTRLLSIGEVEDQIESLEAVSLDKKSSWCMCGVVTKSTKKYITLGDLATKLIKVKVNGKVPPVNSVVIIINSTGERLVNPYTRDVSFHLTTSAENCLVAGTTKFLGFCNRVVSDKLGKKKKCGTPIDLRTAFKGCCRAHQRTAADNVATSMLSGIDVSQLAVKSSHTSKRKLWEGSTSGPSKERVAEAAGTSTPIPPKEDVKLNPTKRRLFERYGRRT
eukprot:TRINITY_DN17196_c0_g1_i1.p1 TRINITY_DN17196_c0_g1~~TRINITY_DN17196_c0_g1_i1.p1  ORF type:complete len:255 (+),score=41.28 TRINITY_DN17196_c0_g1_i1:76-765(+)